MARRIALDRKLMVVMSCILLILATLSVVLNDTNSLPGRLVVLILIYIAFLAIDAATRMNHASRLVVATVIILLIEFAYWYLVETGGDLAKFLGFATLPVVVYWAAEPRTRGDFGNE